MGPAYVNRNYGSSERRWSRLSIFEYCCVRVRSGSTPRSTTWCRPTPLPSTRSYSSQMRASRVSIHSFFLSPYITFTVSLSMYRSISLYYSQSLFLSLTVSLSLSLCVSLSHCLTVSPTVSMSQVVSLFIFLSDSFICLYLSFYLSLSLFNN